MTAIKFYGVVINSIYMAQNIDLNASSYHDQCLENHYPLGKMIVVFEVLFWLLWVISSPIFMCICMLTEYVNRKELHVLKEKVDKIHHKESVYYQDFIEYSHHDRNLFCLCSA